MRWRASAARRVADRQHRALLLAGWSAEAGGGAAAATCGLRGELLPGGDAAATSTPRRRSGPILPRTISSAMPAWRPISRRRRSWWRGRTWSLPARPSGPTPASGRWRARWRPASSGSRRRTSRPIRGWRARPSPTIRSGRISSSRPPGGARAGSTRPRSYAAARDLPPRPRTAWPAVAEIDGVTYWNDSKATNFHAVEAALRRFPEPVLLIAGGKAKGGDLAAFIRRITPRVRRIFLIGETAVLLAAACVDTGLPHAVCANLADAVRRAAEAATPGEPCAAEPGLRELRPVPRLRGPGPPVREPGARPAHPSAQVMIGLLISPPCCRFPVI